MEIRPIRSQADSDAVVAEIERLWDADPGTDDGDKLDILATLVEKYENEHWPIDISRVDPVDMLNYLIEEGGHTQAELAELLGSRSRASEILNRRRALTVEMIHAQHRMESSGGAFDQALSIEGCVNESGSQRQGAGSRISRNLF